MDPNEFVQAFSELFAKRPSLAQGYPEAAMTREELMKAVAALQQVQKEMEAAAAPPIPPGPPVGSLRTGSDPATTSSIPFTSRKPPGRFVSCWWVNRR